MNNQFHPFIHHQDPPEISHKEIQMNKQYQDLAQHFSYLTTTAIVDSLNSAGLSAYTIPVMKFFSPALTKLFLVFLTTNYTKTELSNTMKEI